MKIACNVTFAQTNTHAKQKKYGQMSAKAGIRKFGQTAIAAMIKELTRLDEGAVPGKPVVVPVDASTLIALEKGKFLRALNLIKEKRSRELKGRSCVNRSKQRRYLKECESVSSPTDLLELLITTFLVDAYK